MAYCKNCINAVESNLPEGGLYCTMFRSLCGDTIGCSSGVDGKRKPKTNADRLTRWEGQDKDGPRAVMVHRDGNFAEEFQKILRKLARYEDEDERRTAERP